MAGPHLDAKCIHTRLALTPFCTACYPIESAEIGIFANVVRQIWGFIGPFWFPSMFESAGIKGSAGIMVGVSVIASLVPIIAVQFFGARLRQSR